MFVFVSAEYQKAQIGNDQEKAQSRGGKKLNWQLGTYT